MTYDFKKLEELGWFAAVAAGLAVLQILVSFDPAKIGDWKLWAISLGGSAIRAAAGAIIAKATQPS